METRSPPQTSTCQISKRTKESKFVHPFYRHTLQDLQKSKVSVVREQVCADRVSVAERIQQSVGTEMSRE